VGAGVGASVLADEALPATVALRQQWERDRAEPARVLRAWLGHVILLGELGKRDDLKRSLRVRGGPQVEPR
jgi:hypothetical protein